MFNNKKYNIVLMIICRFTKYILYIFITKRFIVEGFTILFLFYNETTIEYCILSLNGWPNRKAELTFETLSIKLLQLRVRRLSYQIVLGRIYLQYFMVFIDENYSNFGLFKI